MLAVPLVVGLVASGRPTPAPILLAAGMVLVFMARYAAMPWLVRVAAGKATGPEFAFRRIVWTAVYVGASFSCLLGAIATIETGRRTIVVAAAALPVVLGGTHATAGALGRDRDLVWEIVGMAGLATAAPLLVAASDRPLDGGAAGIAILVFGYLLTTVFFVRSQRVAGSKRRGAFWVSTAAHGAVIAAAAVLWKLGWLPGKAAAAPLLLCVRVVWATYRPAGTVRELGWREAAMAVAFTTVVVAGLLV